MPPRLALHTVLHTPTFLCPLFVRPHQTHYYHSYEHAQPPPYSEIETRILASALTHVPGRGFTQEALALGAKDIGYRDISTNILRHGVLDLVKYHLVTQRLNLKNRTRVYEDARVSVEQKVRSLVLERLKGNVETGVVGRWQEALGIMSLAENVPASLRELVALADEILFLAGDMSVDSSWYSKRASLGTVYAATETFQMMDQSIGFKDTEQFLDRRLDEVRAVGGVVDGTTQWVGFQASSLINLLRSKGMTI